MAVLLENLIVSTLARRPDAAGCLEGSTCYVQDAGAGEGKRYQVRGGVWRALLDEPQIEADEDIGAGGGGGAQFFNAITGLTGGGSTNVDGLGVAADSLAENKLICFPNMTGGHPKFWHLVAGTDAQSTDNYIIRPADFADPANAYVLKGFL